ncbi:MAG: hypothetical protein KGH77_02640 [Candidatus Micrarchaeota archaeon]|nr:hypothetical protein [Candidatus Micrarchaeota archaeon]MDE1864300.1 hypothetical protein [Candidatus Micrarchaeota archaeon]
MPDELFGQVIKDYVPDASLLVKKRQEVLKGLETELQATVVAYIGNTNHPLSSIMPQDVDAIMDLVNIASKKGKKIYLILESFGGDGNVAEKLISVFRTTFSDGFYVIIPNNAKSAATMLALGSDKIIMGINSELGPIDPQIQVQLPSGQVQYVPAKSITGAVEKVKKEVGTNEKLASVYYPILQQIRPEQLKFCEDAIKFSTAFAERWLDKGCMKGKGKKDITAAVEELTTGDRFNMHGSVINFEEAKRMGLNVEMWKIEENKWKLVWQYYLRVKASFQINPNATKLFESTDSSVNMNVQIIPMGNQPR